MRIIVRTGGLLGQYLPEGNQNNRAELEVEAGTTPFDVMRRLAMPEDRTYLVVLNGTSISRADRESRQLAEDDNLAILPPLKGG
jgi:sulfur carrier protein ThiS